MKSIVCPTCEWEWRKPWKVRPQDVAYSDACCCGDTVTCVRHQWLADDTAQRPSEEVLAEKAKRLTETRIKDWEDKAIRLEEAVNYIGRIKELEAALTLTANLGGMVADRESWQALNEAIHAASKVLKGY